LAFTIYECSIVNKVTYGSEVFLTCRMRLLYGAFFSPCTLILLNCDVAVACLAWGFLAEGCLYVL
jgi:hypothetical protein